MHHKSWHDRLALLVEAPFDLLQGFEKHLCREWLAASIDLVPSGISNTTDPLEESGHDLTQVLLCCLVEDRQQGLNIALDDIVTREGKLDPHRHRLQLHGFDWTAYARSANGLALFR